MSRETEDAVYIGGFWIFSFFSVVLAILKLTVVAYWSWWRVALPLLAFLGHNALYILTAFICFHWLKVDERGIDLGGRAFQVRLQHHGTAICLSFFDNLLRREEGQGWGGFWPCSGRLEVAILYVVLSLSAHFAFWSRIVSGLNQKAHNLAMTFCGFLPQA